MKTKKVIWPLWILFVFVLILSLLRSFLLARQAEINVSKQQQRLEQLQLQVDELEQQVQDATSSFTLEKRAREELKLQKPEETIILLPTPLIN